MSSIAEIKKPIEKELDKFNEEFDKCLTSENEILSVVHRHIKNNKGKQIRPTLTLLASKLCKQNVENESISVALSLELLHTASLVHDDVVDESKLRRGQSSVNAIWDNQIAVLTGDYLLSESLNMSCKTNNVNIVNNICTLGKKLSEGELLQISNVQTISLSEDRYIQVIKNKTAMLFSVCTLNGAIAAGATYQQAEQLKKYGEMYGIAFQIRDDIFDYISSADKIGKPVGNDIREGKITLPLLYAINNTNGAEKDVVMQILRDKDFSADNVEEIVNFAIRKGGIEYAEQRIDYYSTEAIKCLEMFDDNECKKSLIDMVEVSRKRTS